MKTYVFIDSKNLNLGTSKDIFHGKKLIYKGWRLDFEKFRKYLSEIGIRLKENEQIKWEA